MLLVALLYGGIATSQDTLNRVDAEGRKQGLWRTFYPSGELETEVRHDDGLRQGIHLTFWEKPNCIKEEARYRNDTLNGYVIEYYRNCKGRRRLEYRAGVQDGEEIVYGRNGKVQTRGTFKNGELLGFYRHYNSEGEVRFESPSELTNIDLEAFLKGEYRLPDSLVLHTIPKLQVTDRTVIVTDVTGSMYPYVGQLLIWYKEQINSTPIRRFMFFNDGDNKPDLTKKPGSTGGLYPIETDNPRKLMNIMETAIGKGGGGDAIENDVEAILAARKRWKDADRIILIGDISPMRDMNLAGSLRIPVDVILCGSLQFAYSDYLNLASRNGGKIASLDLEPTQLTPQSPALRLGPYHYSLQGGKWRRLIFENLQ